MGKSGKGSTKAQAKAAVLAKAAAAGRKKADREKGIDPDGPAALQPSQLLRLPDGAVALSQLSTERLPGVPKDKADALARMAEMGAPAR